ncbi:MAG: glycine cleavage system aminomethyltransferase GcvT [Burkholderiales bacterium]
MPHTTVLNAEHRAAGAKMVDFGGWDMPLHYGSQMDEHHRVRGDAGVFDVSHMLAVDVEGANAQAFLEWLLSNSVAKLTVPGRALYSCMLREDGGILDDLIVYYLQREHYRLVVNAGTAEKDMAWMALQASTFPGAPRIAARRDLAMLAIQGPKARQKTWDALPHLKALSEPLPSFSAARAGEWLVARTGYTGEDGFEVMLPASEAVGVWRTLLRHDIAPIGLGARDTLRLEAGMNLYGQDMDESVTPPEAGLAWTCDTSSPREFAGRGALATRVPRFKLAGLLLLDKGVLRAHQHLITPSGPGEITSGTFSPTLAQSIALARVPLAVRQGDIVEAEIRERRARARVVKYPFARHGRALVTADPQGSS